MNSGAEQGRADVKVRWWNGTPAKLVSGVLILTLATGTAVWSIVADQQERAFLEQRIREAGITSTVLSRDFAQPMSGGAGGAVWRALSADAAEFTRKKLAARVLVFLRDGRVMSASEQSAVGTRIEVRGNPECPACDSARAEDFPASAEVRLAGGARGLRVVSPIPVTDICRFCHKTDDKARSFVAVDFDLSALERARGERQRSILILGIGSSALLALLVTLLFRRVVMRPVAALMQSMARIAAGDLSARTQALGSDEFTLLGRHFNHMADRIEEQVARIDAARTESELLYRLVVDASKNLETNDFANAVARVVMEKLWPQRVAFFLECADGGWICATRGNPEAKALEHGEGDLQGALGSASPQVSRLLAGVPPQLVEDAGRAHTLQLVRAASGLSIALPVVSESRLVGLLACPEIPEDARVDEALLGNLGAHLNLAAVNSRNYTGAITDALTGLKNKRYGLARLDEAVNFARRRHAELGLAMCDIDHFKRVNDDYGHPAGDAVLRDAGRRIAACLRKSDIAVRYGGEEFMLILPEAAPSGLVSIGEKIRSAVQAAPLALGAGGGSVALTLSVGVAAFRADSDSAETLIARADAALYRAREGGRNRVAVEWPEAEGARNCLPS